MPVISIKKNPLAVKKSKRIGRGIGSGRGGYSGRGAKGQKARSGGNINPAFEGGQMPLYRRLPKRGFKNNNKKIFNIVNISSLSVFKDGGDITIEKMKEAGIIKDNSYSVKLLGNGEIKAKVNITVNNCSETAKKKIEKAGGKVTLIG